MQGRQRPVVSRVERGQQVEGLAAAHLADHDPVRSHAQGVSKQVANRHLAAPLDALGPTLQTHHVGLTQAELRRVLDRDHAFLGADVGRQRVEQRRLTGPGATRDQDAAPAANRLRQEVAKLGGERPGGDQLIWAGASGGEAADRERRAVDRQRRDDDVDARAVGEPRVDHRAELVDPTAERREDPLDGVAKGTVGLEPDLGRLDPPTPLDVDLVGPVHHHLSDGGVGEHLLERAEADRVPQDQLADPGAAILREHRGMVVDDLRHRALELVAARPSRGRLGATALDQALPQVGGERLGIAIGRSHATVNPAQVRRAPDSRRPCRRTPRLTALRSPGGSLPGPGLAPRGA